MPPPVIVLPRLASSGPTFDNCVRSTGSVPASVGGTVDDSPEPLGAERGCPAAAPSGGPSSAALVRDGSAPVDWTGGGVRRLPQPTRNRLVATTACKTTRM